MLNELREQSKRMQGEGRNLISKKQRKGLRRIYRQQLVKRSALLKIVAAWLITVPVSAFLAAMLYFTIRGMMLP